MENKMFDPASAAGSARPSVSSRDLSPPVLALPSARYVFSDIDAPFSLSFIAIGPTFEFGDHTVCSTIDDAQECQIQFGESGRPSYAAAVYDTVIDAVDDALIIVRHHPHLKLWYNGLEVQAEFSDWRSLAALLSNTNETWEIVEEVAAGHRRPTDPSVSVVVADDQILAVAVERVKP
jgi:hypothetical protein